MFSFVNPSKIRVNDKKLSNDIVSKIKSVARINGKIKYNNITKTVRSRPIYYYPIDIIDDNHLNKIELFDDIRLVNRSGKLTFLPYTNTKRLTMYITGCSGAGKSYLATSVAKEYQKYDNEQCSDDSDDDSDYLDILDDYDINLDDIYEPNRVILISPKNDDKNLDSIPDLEKITPKMVHNNGYKTEDFKNSLVIFDDYEGITDKNIMQSVINLRDCMLVKSRSLCTSVICISHICTNALKTKVCLLESQYFAYFPRMGVNKGVENFFQRYLGYPIKHRKKLLSVNSRKVILRYHHPNYIMTDRRLCLLNKFFKD